MANILRSAHDTVAHLTTVVQQPIKPGARIPSTPVKEDDPNATITLSDKEGKIIIIGVPGAFTTPCTSQVGGYLENYDKFKEKGVKDIFVVAVNDVFVVKAWKEKLAPNGTPLHFIADDKGTFVSDLGLIFDAAPLLGSQRSKRFALVAENGVVQEIAVEDEASNVTATAAEVVLAFL